MSADADTRVPDVGYYYPNPFWSNGDWVKSMVLFFDGIALLVPKYMEHKLEHFDPAIVEGLRQHDLLHIITPEQAIDKAATKTLASALTDIIASGVLDRLAQEKTQFHELSMSRLGYFGDEQLADSVFKELRKRKLAKETEDGVSIPMHPLVRCLVLTLLSQIMRSYGAAKNLDFSPITDNHRIVQSLVELLSIPTSPSRGQVVSFDLNAVSVDLGAFPIDEILDFRRENKSAFSHYRRATRLFAYDLSRMSKEERELAFEDRQAKLDEMATDLKRRSRRAWKKPASVALGLSGAAWTLATGDPLGAVLAGGASLLNLGESAGTDVGAYSYLFRAHERYA